MLVFLSISITTAGRLTDSFLSLAVTNVRSRPSGDSVVEFDEFGGLPQLENTYRAIGKSASVVAIRTVNATLLSHTAKNSSSLQIPVGAQSLNSLINPWQYLLITGLAGDARCVVRHAKQVVLNYTVAFDSPPSGRYIAHEVGKFLQEYTVRGGIRPLACHTFIADSLIEKSLYEVDAAGNVAQIWAGVGGRSMAMGRNILEGHLNGTAVSSVETARAIAESILKVPDKGTLQMKKLGEGADGDEVEENKDFIVTHFVLYDKDSR